MRGKAFRETIRRYQKIVCPIDAKREKDQIVRFRQLALTHPQLAADSILQTSLSGSLSKFIDDVLYELDGRNGILALPSLMGRNVYEAMIETALNVIGMEANYAGFSRNERDAAVTALCAALRGWEEKERRVRGQAFDAKDAVKRILEGMKRVLSGKSMVAKIAENIERELDAEHMAESFILAAKKAIENNVYHKMRLLGMSKFGNDSATGLRFVRHLDFIQVSSNPVIASRAYEEFPKLWDEFREIVDLSPEWRANPEKYGDEIVLWATITSLLPNVLAFRPIALLSDFRAGLVSYQLNPFGAESVKASVRDAESICSILREILCRYDAWLGWDAKAIKGRPNIVCKVAASSPAAKEITRTLNRKGIGTNNTVTYSVSQELTLIMAAAEGMAEALKRGTRISQVYETNMIGRLEDHLREVEAERVLAALGDADIDRLAVAACGTAEGTRSDKIKALASKKNLKSLTDERFLNAFTGIYSEEIRNFLIEREEAIQHAGIFVTRRVWQLFFGQKNWEKWKRYFKTRLGLSFSEAYEVMTRIDLLPASKRRARDTYGVLGVPNVTNTEFPDQQLRVFTESESPGFTLEKYQGSITEDPDPAILETLLEIIDFRRAYELTPSLEALLKAVGVEDTCDGGRGGLEPEAWPSFGAVIKTTAEFREAYRGFREHLINFVRE